MDLRAEEDFREVVFQEEEKEEEATGLIEEEDTALILEEEAAKVRMVLHLLIHALTEVRTVVLHSLNSGAGETGTRGSIHRLLTHVTHAPTEAREEDFQDLATAAEVSAEEDINFNSFLSRFVFVLLRILQSCRSLQQQILMKRLQQAQKALPYRAQSYGIFSAGMERT